MLRNAAKGDVDHATLLAAAMELVNVALMRSLGVTEPLDPARPLAYYGVDSLVAVELRSWARLELGIEMGTLEILETKTLTALCDGMLKKLL
jgi:aryl carrier-like protein